MVESVSDELQGRLESLVLQIESRFSEVVLSTTRLEREGTYCGVSRHAPAEVVEERRYVHKKYLNGWQVGEGESTIHRLKLSPEECLPEFEEKFVPLAAQHSGTLYWRVRPEFRRYQGEDMLDPEKRWDGWCVQCRCSFGDAPDEVWVPKDLAA